MNKLKLSLLVGVLTGLFAFSTYAQDSLALKQLHHVTDSVNGFAKHKQQKLDSLHERASCNSNDWIRYGWPPTLS